MAQLYRDALSGGLDTGSATSLENINKPFMAKLTGVGNTLVGVALVSGGNNYTPGQQYPAMFKGGGGSGAAAIGIAESSGNGAITAVQMTNYGSGYTSAPAVTFGNGNAVGLGMIPWSWVEQDESTSVGLVDKVGGRYGTVTWHPAVNPNANPTLYPVYVQLRRGWLSPQYDWVYTYTNVGSGGSSGGGTVYPLYYLDDVYGNVYVYPNPQYVPGGNQPQFQIARFPAFIVNNNGDGSYQVQQAVSASGGGWNSPPNPLLTIAWEWNSNPFVPDTFVVDVEWDSKAKEYRFRCDISEVNRTYQDAESDGNCHSYQYRFGVLVEHDGQAGG